MTHKRLNLLLISIISLLLCLLLISTAARADDRGSLLVNRTTEPVGNPSFPVNSDWSWMAQAGVKTTFASSMGYDPGIGVQGEAGVRWKFLETHLSGDWIAQHKKTATSGSHYHAALELRSYVYGPFYLVGQYQRGGYWTHFESNDPDTWAKAGTTWSKHGHHWIAGVGYNDGNSELSLRYGFREHETPNQTDFVGLLVQQRTWKNLFVCVELYYSTWNQNAGQPRIDGFTSAFSVVWRFEG